MENQDFNIRVYPLEKMLHKLAHRIMRDLEEAKDAVQDVYLKFLSRKEPMDYYSNMEAVVILTTRNHCLNKLKENRARQESLKNYAKVLEEEEIPIDFTLENMLWEIVGELPIDQQIIIQLREVEGLKFKKIAEMLSMNIVSVRVCHTRALRKLMEELLKSRLYEIRPN